LGQDFFENSESLWIKLLLYISVIKIAALHQVRFDQAYKSCDYFLQLSDPADNVPHVLNCEQVALCKLKLTSESLILRCLSFNLSFKALAEDSKSVNILA
jgi:hypothetical protein